MQWTHHTNTITGTAPTTIGTPVQYYGRTGTALRGAMEMERLTVEGYCGWIGRDVTRMGGTETFQRL